MLSRSPKDKKLTIIDVCKIRYLLDHTMLSFIIFTTKNRKRIYQDFDQIIFKYIKHSKFVQVIFTMSFRQATREMNNK